MISFYGIKADETRELLSNITQASVCISMDSPQDAVSLKIPIKEDMFKYDKLEVRWKDDVILVAIVTKEAMVFEGNKRSMKINAYGIAKELALSEALAQQYYMPSLSNVCYVHAVPYGIKEWRGAKTNFTGEFSVGKGTSEWGAIKSFCNIFLQTKPRIIGDGILDCTNNLSEYIRKIDCKNIISIAQTEDRKNCISEISLQTSEGGYDKTIKNTLLERKNIIRRKCYSTLSQNEVSAYEVLLDSMLGYRSIEIKAVDYIGIPGERVELDFLKDKIKSPYIFKVEYHLKNGESYWKAILWEEIEGDINE